LQAFLQGPAWLSPARRQELIDEERSRRQKALTTAENQLARAKEFAAILPNCEGRKVRGNAALHHAKCIFHCSPQEYVVSCGLMGLEFLNLRFHINYIDEPSTKKANK
jgi:hypothetical protein